MPTDADTARQGDLTRDGDDAEQVLLMPRGEDQSRTQPAELAQPIVRDVRDNQYWHVDYD